MPNPSHAAQFGPRLRRDEAEVRQNTVGVFRGTTLAEGGVLAYVQAFNVAARVDRLGGLGDPVVLARALGRAFGSGIQTRREWPIIEAAVRDYRNRRAKANGPLRFKKPHRVRLIPAVGYLEREVNNLLRAKGVNLHNVLSKRLLRSGRAFVVNVTLKVPKRDRVEDARRRYQKHYHRSRIQDVGLCMTPTGLDIMVVNNPQRWNSKRVLDHYHVPVKDVLTPGFLRDLLRTLTPLVNTLALDESWVPALPGALRSANTELRRWCRAQKAAGAAEFGLVSPVWQEAQETLEYAKSVGFYSEDLRGVLWDVRRSFILKCPHCGAPVALKLDPHTQVPAEGAVTCSECHVAVPVGLLLATRASALVQDDWLHYGGAPRTKGLDRPKTAPSRQTTTKNNKNRAGKAPTPLNPKT